MIKYDKFWETLEKRHISQYHLIQKCGIDKKLLRRLKHNENVEMRSLDKLCTILCCKLEDIAEYVPDSQEEEETAIVDAANPEDTDQETIVQKAVNSKTADQEAVVDTARKEAAAALTDGFQKR